METKTVVTRGELDQLIRTRMQMAEDKQIINWARTVLKQLHQKSMTTPELEVKLFKETVEGKVMESGELKFDFLNFSLVWRYVYKGEECERLEIRFQKQQVFHFNTSVLNPFKPKLLGYIPGVWEQFLSADAIVAVVRRRQERQLKKDQKKLQDREQQRLNEPVGEQELNTAITCFGLEL